MTGTKVKRRSRPLRQERDDVLLFVTTRTIEERFWLHPLVTTGANLPNRKARRALVGLERLCKRRYERMAKVANAASKPSSPKWTPEEIQKLSESALTSALGRAQKRHKVEVVAVMAMSNHVHLVIRTPNRNCAAFLRDFKAVAARNLNRVHGRKGPVWARRADVQHVLDDGAGAERVTYTLRNPEKAGLVTDPEQWPGLSLCFGLGDTDEVPYTVFDFVSWRRARRPKDKDRFFVTDTLVLSPLPAMEGMSREAYAADVRAWIAKQIREDQEQRAQAHDVEPKRPRPKDVLGVEAVIKAAFHQRPKKPNFSPRPYCFGSADNKRAFYEQTNHTVAAHQLASERYLGGDRTAAFPPGTYPPPIIQAAA